MDKTRHLAGFNHTFHPAAATAFAVAAAVFVGSAKNARATLYDL